MTISHCNSAHTRTDPSEHSELYSGFLQHLKKQTASGMPPEQDLLLMRMVLTLASHVKTNLSIQLAGQSEDNRLDPLLSYARSTWPHLVASPDTFDIIIDCQGDLCPGELLKDGGWFIQPKAHSSDSGFACLQDFEFLDWRIRRRDIDVNKFDGTIHIIVPVHNRCAITLDFLSTVREQSLAHALEVIIIDDGSTDGLQEQLKQHFPETTILEGDGSLWWGGAINKGLDHVRTQASENDFVAFVNNDVLLEPGTFEHLVKRALSDRAVCLAPMTVANGDATAPGEIGYTLYRFEQAEQHFLQHNRWTRVEHLFGRCSMFSAQLLKEVASVDAHLFPQYWGDSDFFLRAGAAGYPSFVTGETYIRVHHGEETTGSHHNFFAEKRGFRETWRYLTETRSLGAVQYGWRFFKRHNKKRTWSFAAKTIFRALRNLRLSP